MLLNMAQFFSSSTQLFVPLGDDAGVVGAVVRVVDIKVVLLGWPFDDTELAKVCIVVSGVVICAFVVVVVAAVEVVDSFVAWDRV